MKKTRNNRRKEFRTLELARMFARFIKSAKIRHSGGSGGFYIVTFREEGGQYI